MITLRKVHADIGAYLLGTCLSTEDAAEAFGVSDAVVEEAIHDLEIFRCDDCGWWFEIDHKSDTEYANTTGGDICEDCGDYDGGSD